MRRLLVLLMFGAIAVPALAATDHTVGLSGVSFGPKEVTVAVGDTVNWRNDGGGHNVRFADQSTAMPEFPTGPSEFNAADVKRTFDTPGTYKYYCVAHASGPDDAGGMTGTVVVQDGAPPTPAPTQTPAPSPTPTVPTFTATARKKPFCVKRSCDKRGVRLTIEVEGAEGLELAGPLKKGLRTVGTVSYDAPAGTSTLRFVRVARKRLKAGRYKLTLYAKGGVKPVTIAFRIA